MKTVFFDIETIPCQLPGVLDEFKAAVTAPAQYKKPESIAEWLKENRDSEGEAAWLKTSFDGGMGHVVCIGLAVDDGDEAGPHKAGETTSNSGEDRDVLRRAGSVRQVCGKLGTFAGAGRQDLCVPAARCG